MTAWGRPTRLPIDPAGTPDRGFATMRVTSPYGRREGAFSGFHGGLDIGNARLGDDVIAAGSGLVIHASDQPAPPWNYAAPADKVAVWGPSYGGKVVVVDHGEGWYSQYVHLAAMAVAKGQRVVRGAPIGPLGDSGSAAPPPAGGGGHLHFGIRYLGAVTNGQNGWIDPWPLIQAAAAGDLPTIPDTATEDETVWRPYARLITPTELTLAGGTIPYAGPGREYGEHSPGYRHPEGDRVVSTIRVDLPANAGTWYGCARQLGGALFWEPKSGIQQQRSLAPDCGKAVQDATLALSNRLERKQAALEAAGQALQAAISV